MNTSPLQTKKTLLILFIFFIEIFALTNPVFSAPNQEQGNQSRSQTEINKNFQIKIIFLEGSVLLNGKPAEIGTIVPVKSSIITGPDSYCEIIFNNKNIFQIRQKTQAVLDFSHPSIQVEINKGGIAAVLRKLSKSIQNEDTFIIKTPASVAGVRGTSLCVWSDGIESYVCACNGTVRTLDPLGSNEYIISATHHQAKRYIPVGAEFKTEVAGLEFHTDEDLEALAAKIGETIDWNKTDR